ncbi:Putative ATP-dependent RNA helicase dbp6 [[Torrubiella] hemipterigena]|uniref:ATP-dependent RNA helicase n=1 Tax=[Torrubiella] hemipterigena TaxID=1531966 RepID=A0A0A1T7H3_9HYPO|nr:Putative ATP-dependent RNA helicase dbp6 [[Torrubiella] hemipterigena]
MPSRKSSSATDASAEISKDRKRSSVDDDAPAKSKRKRDRDEGTDEEDELITKKSKSKNSKPPHDDDDHDSSKKSKKAKKSKRAKTPDTTDTESTSSDSDDTSDIEMKYEDASEPAAVEKVKRKKEKVRKPRIEESDDEDPKDARHKALLERKEKSLKISMEAAKHLVEEPVEDVEMYGLEPLPQPDEVIDTTSKPTYQTLPSWLAAPIRVSQSKRMPFTNLGILPKAAKVLEEKGYADAFAVQTAAIPLLLPSVKHHNGDLLISAATGSGKTLAYALPIVRDISQGVVTRLRALVVLPTRELVRQAQEAFENCARAYEGENRKKVRIGISIGSQSLKNEQEALVESESRYDPERYEILLKEIRTQKGLRSETSEAELDDINEDPRIGKWDGEVVDFHSKVDVLICTPGRLVEHLEQTAGFGLDYVRWLVVDEADKLLAQSFQGWLETVMARFRTNIFGARDFPDVACSGVRKIVLSATLTRDLSLLNQLGLRRPQLIVLESDPSAEVSEHSLPDLLKEFAVRVHDANLKPLYLLDLLRGADMAAEDKALSSTGEEASTSKTDDSSDSSASSDSSDSSDSDSSDSSDSDSSSDSSSDSDSSDSDSDSDSESTPTPAPKKSNIPIALIFTKSNESALRLSRLLAILDPSLTAHINTITSTTPTHVRRKTLRAFTTPSSPIRLIIASDLVARGIDIPKLGHVVNYDLPASLAGYVHRVGRTARAGRAGCAWTLVDDRESGWFWGKIAKGSGVRRAKPVARVRIEEMEASRVDMYEQSLEKLGKEAVEKRRK